MTTFNLGTARGSVAIDTSDVRSASKDLKNADIVLRQTGAAAIDFGTTLLKGFGYIVGVGARFEKEMDFIQAVTNGTVDDMEKLKQSTISLAKEGKFGPIELAQAFVELAKAGITAQDIIQGVGKAVVNLAQAADIGAEQAGQIVVQTMSTFGLAASEVERATDLIAGAANASIIDVQDFAVTLRYAGPVASALGVDLEDLATTIALLGQAGIRGSQAGTSLRQTMLNFTGPTKAAKEALTDLGLITKDGANQFYTAKGELKDLTTIFNILGKAVSHLNEKQKTDVLRTIFGVRQMPAVLFLLSQGEKAFTDMNDAINRVTAADVAAKRLDNLQGAIARFKATLEAVLLGPAGPFQNMLKNVVNFGRRLLLMFDKLPGPIQTFLVASLGVVGVLAVMSGVFLLTIGNIVRMVRVLGELATVAARLPALLRSVAAGNSLLSASFLASPIFWIVLLVLALAVAFAALYLKVKGFRDFIDGLGRGLRDFGVAVGNFVVDKIKMLGQAFASLVGFFSGGGLKKIAIELVKLFSRISELPGMVGRAVASGGRLILKGLSRVPFYIGFILGRITRGLMALPGLFARVFLGLTKGILSLLFRLLTSIKSFFLSVLVYLVGLLPQLISLGFLMGGAIVGGIIAWVKDLPSNVKKFFFMAKQAILGFLGQFSVLAWQFGTAIVKGIIDVIKGLPGMVWDILVAVVTKLKEAVSRVFNAAKDFGSSIWNGFRKGMGIASPSFIEEAMTNITNQGNKSISMLRRQVAALQGLGAGIPMNYATPTMPSITANSSGVNGVTHNYNAPLIGQATIRNEEDITKLARALTLAQSQTSRGREQR